MAGEFPSGRNEEGGHFKQMPDGSEVDMGELVKSIQAIRHSIRRAI